jgi:hypothetical protein
LPEQVLKEMGHAKKITFLFCCKVEFLRTKLIHAGMELRIYSFTSPGGPAYPTRAVRHAAWNTLDFLFPVSFLCIWNSDEFTKDFLGSILCM